MRSRGPQRGAALVIVLLLVATLSFVLLSLTTTVTTGVRRGASERARTEMLWRAVAAERIALSVLEKAASAGALETASNEGGLFSQQLPLPVERGEAALRFADASRCFNVNALLDEDFALVPEEKQRLTLLLEAIGLGGGESASVADAIADFLDADANQESQGAEDNFYTGLSTPFRTAGGPVAAVSELRAVDGVTREIYARIAPFLCAREPGRKVELNVNAMTPEDAPLIFAATLGDWSVNDVSAHLSQRPPGGWRPDAAAFWSAFGNPNAINLTGLANVEPTWIETRVLLESGERSMEETLIIEMASGGKPSIYARVLGGGS